MQVEIVKCEVTALELRPTQRLVAKVPIGVPKEAMMRLREALAKFLDVEQSRVMVMPQGIELDVVDQPPSLEMGVQNIG
jgi:hypothetical protein